MKRVYIPFNNLSFNTGRLNSAGLIQADGVIHSGAGFSAPPPFFKPGTALTGAGASVDDPIFACVNTSEANSSDFSIYVYMDGKVYRYDVSGAPPWTPAACLTLGTKLVAGEGGMIPFGQNVVLAAGHSNHVQIRLDGQANFQDCFTSDDKPKFKYVGALGQSLVFANAANTGQAGTPDPNGSLVWWGAVGAPRTIGTEETHPDDATGFASLFDPYGDIRAVGNGKRNCVIGKDRAIYLMHLDDLVSGFVFDRISAGVGLAEARSLVDLYDDTYGWSTVGPAVVRGEQLILLGDGYWTVRSLLNESPAVPALTVLSSFVDRDNALVGWLLKYQSIPYTYDDSSGQPVETEGTAATMWALLVYNVISNQFSFVWRQRSDTGINMIDEASPGTPVVHRPLCMVDSVPWNNYFPMRGVGFFSVVAASDPVLFLSGLSGSTFTPTWTLGQDTVLSTGLVPLSGKMVTVHGVRPVLRSRRAKTLPELSVRVRTALAPWDTERIAGPYTKSSDSIANRAGWIKTKTANGTLVGIELTVEDRTAGSPVGYSFLLEEIEGVEVEFEETGG